MDKKSKIFFLVFFLLIVGSVVVTYWRIMVNRDYIIQAQQECDPALEACFVSVCDSEGDPECAALPEEEQVSYYKTISKNAKNIPLCDANNNECPTELSCEPGEEECELILCDESSVPEGEECNDPTKYLEENPPCDCDESGEEIAEEEESGDELTEGDGEASNLKDVDAEISAGSSTEVEEVATDGAESEEEGSVCACGETEGENTEDSDIGDDSESLE